MSVSDDAGNYVEGNLVANKFVEHFKNFLSTVDNVDPISDAENLFVNRLSETKSLSMIEEVSSTEIKNDMFGMKDEKAPGPDGFTVAFFKKA